MRSRGLVKGVVVVAAALATAGVTAAAVRAETCAIGCVGTPSTGAPGIERTVADIEAVSREAVGSGTGATFLVPPRRVPREGRSGSLLAGSPAAAGSLVPSPLLAVASSFAGPTLADSLYVPPDTDAAVGPTQVLVALNGRIRVYPKSGVAVPGELDATLTAFFSSVLTASTPSRSVATSDPRVVFDATSGRWFVSAIEVPRSLPSNDLLPNRLLLAVSSGDTITDSSSFRFFQFEHDTISADGHDTGDFADFPTLGVDANAVYFGAQIFTPPGVFVNTSVFVVRKASVLGSGPIVVTPFRDLIANVAAPGSNNIAVAQGATNPDPAATEGYFVGADYGAFGRLDVRRVSDPGGTPTLSGDLAITVSPTAYPGSAAGVGRITAMGTNSLDATDDRLSAASIRNGKLYVTQAIGLDSAGAATSSPTRTGVRWYELTGLTGTPALSRQGTIFDAAGSNQKSYWMPSIAVSGQGHAVIGMSSASAVAPPSGAVSSMLSGGSAFSTPADFITSASNYSRGSTPDRWGDYSMTTVDPCDGQTFWTIQEYVPSTNAWGVRIAKIAAPGPATPATLAPAAVSVEQPSVDVAVTGTSTGGSGFWDPGSGACRIAASFSGSGVTVNSVTFTDATHAVVNVSTVGATAGTSHDLTITNPDGQTASLVAALTVTAPPPPPEAEAAEAVVAAREAAPLTWWRASWLPRQR